MQKAAAEETFTVTLRLKRKVELPQVPERLFLSFLVLWPWPNSGDTFTVEDIKLKPFSTFYELFLNFAQ